MRNHFYPLAIFAGLVCLMSMLAATTFAQAVTGTPTEVVIPFMKTPPKIDGVISPGEYPTLHIARLVADGNLALQPRLAEFWLGSDGKLLYLAMRTAVNPNYGANIVSYPTKGNKDAGALFGGIFGMVHEDMIDFWIDSNPGGKQGKWYRVAVNPTGAIDDSVYDHVYNIPNNSWRVTMRQAYTLVNGIWTAEFAIDPHSFGIDLRKPFAIRVNRFFTLPDDYSHWENCSYVADFPGMGVTSPQTMPRIVFRDSAPIVSEVGAQDAGGIDLALDVTNPTAAPLPVKVALGYAPEHTPLAYENSDVTLQPAETRRFALKRPFDLAGNYTASGSERVSSPDGAINYFARDFKWETSPKGAIWDDIKPKPVDPVAHYEIEFHPTPKVLRWRADWNGNPQKAAITQLRLRVVDTANNNIITEQQVKAPASYDYTGQAHPRHLAAGPL